MCNPCFVPGTRLAFSRASREALQGIIWECRGDLLEFRPGSRRWCRTASVIAMARLALRRIDHG